RRFRRKSNNVLRDSGRIQPSEATENRLWHTREMATFVKPTGINFRSDNELLSQVLWKSLCLVVSFLQSVDPYKELHWYWDFWEHNGSEESHWHNKQIDFHQLFKIIDSPRNVL